MTNEFAAPRLDVCAFAQSGGHVAGSERLAGFPRVFGVANSGEPDTTVSWSARGEVRSDLLGQSQYWLRLQADARVPQTCQRCLGEMYVDLHVDRWFRFVASEASATEQDETSEEEILVLVNDFNLHELIEDELLLELPYIARHENCPVPPNLSISDPEFVGKPERQNPFAALAAWKPDEGR
jgi:uncharacterized protein